jgi:hypothetical protein
LNSRIDLIFGFVLSTEVQLDFSWIINMVLSLTIMNMKKVVRTLEMVKTSIVLCAIGAGTLLGKSKYFGCKRIFQIKLFYVDSRASVWGEIPPSPPF